MRYEQERCDVSRVLLVVVVLMNFVRPAWAHKCATVPVQLHGEVIDGMNSNPIAGASILAFVDEQSLPGCWESRGPSLTDATGHFDATSCWTYRAHATVPGAGWCGGVPKSVMLLVQRPGSAPWRETIRLKREHVREVEGGFTVQLPKTRVFGP